MDDSTTPKDPISTNCHHQCSSCGSASRRRASQDDVDERDQLTKKYKRLFPENDEAKTLAPVPLSPGPNIAAGVSPSATTPPYGTKLATSLRRSVSEPASHIQWLIKLKDRMNEIAQMWEEIPKSELLCEEKEISQPLNDHNDGCKAIPSTEVTKDQENENDDSVESVTVERAGKFFNINFKCSCGKGYQFMLSEGSCFYKLM